MKCDLRPFPDIRSSHVSGIALAIFPWQDALFVDADRLPSFTIIYHCVFLQYRAKQRVGAAFGGNIECAYQLLSVLISPPCPYKYQLCDFGVETKVKKGDFVELDGLPAVVVGVYGDPGVPEDHVALWFGTKDVRRKSQGGQGGVVPEVWTVPLDVCEPGVSPVFKH